MNYSKPIEDEIYNIYSSDKENEFLVGIEDEFLFIAESKQCPHCKKYKKIIKHSDIRWGGRDACLSDLYDNREIAYACCGHGDDKQAYILTTDGYRFVLPECENTVYSIEIEGKYVTCVMGINPYVTIELSDGRVFYLGTIKKRLD